MSYNDVTGGDIHDWAGENHDSYDAFGPPDDAQPITAVDQSVVNSVGWIATAVPEPTTAGLMSISAITLLARRRRSTISVIA